MNATPFLVVIEGIDGAGKTTLAALIAAELLRCGYSVVQGKEPTQGPYGRQLRESAATGRKDPSSELELLLLDRAEHVQHVIGPALQAGAMVILDRYYFSNAAYQGAEGLDPAQILTTNEMIAPAPDLVILLDVSPKVGLARITSRGDFPNQFEKEDTLERCRQIFLSIDRPFIKVVDASASIDDVLAAAMRLVIAAFSNKVSATHGLTVVAAKELQPLLAGAYETA